MAIEDVIKLNDAHIKAAQAQAQIADTMAGAAKKIAEIGLIREQVLAARLQNIAKYLDIQWDKQAHDHLLKIRNKALQAAEEAKTESERAKRFAKRLNTLLSGNAELTPIRDAWIAFEYFRKSMPVSALIEIAKLPVVSEVYHGRSWMHGRQPAEDDVPEDQRDPGSLLQWARVHNYIPRMGKPSWEFFAAFMSAMGDAAAKEAEKLETEADAAHKEAIELSKIDWDRLKEDNKPK